MGEDFFPLSKRINSLQISGEFTFAQISMPNLRANNHHHHHLEVSQSSIRNQLHHTHHQQEHQNQPNVLTQVYNPELSLEENPYYYSQNKSLYELYVLRQHRNGKAN